MQRAMRGAGVRGQGCRYAGVVIGHGQIGWSLCEFTNCYLEVLCGATKHLWSKLVAPDLGQPTAR